MPFCPSCGAPQIKVSIGSPQLASSDDPVPPPPPPELSGIVQDLPGPHGRAGQIHWKSFFRIAVPLALITGLAALYPPLGFLVFLGSVVAGIRLYRRRHAETLLAIQGAQLGALLGLMSSLVFAFPPVVGCALDGDACRQAIVDAINKAAAANPDPHMQEKMQSLLQSNRGLMELLAGAAILLMAITLLLGAVSGAVTVVLSADKPGP
jgi:hypothetical protein